MGSGITNRTIYCRPKTKSDKDALANALTYMEEEGQALTSIDIQHVFIGSCTNVRLSDLQEAAKVIQGKKYTTQLRHYCTWF